MKVQIAKNSFNVATKVPQATADNRNVCSVTIAFWKAAHQFLGLELQEVNHFSHFKGRKVKCRQILTLSIQCLWTCLSY